MVREWSANELFKGGIIMGGNDKKNTAPSSGNGINFQFKDRNNLINYLREQVEKGTGKSFLELKVEFSEDKLFFVALQHVSTTKKAISEAMGIPIEAACRYKRSLQKNGLLVESTDEVRCPITKHSAHLLSTNPKEFESLKKLRFKQLNLF
ncbi:hypothetical protein OU798_04485 [Prolixibacteraceae bacterium Z1-6]|uniref:Uncharacterized protein n=1 Tax=Draconibacterium aestuarii TaxID=2998507 RepID=A0A9X3F2Y0_9BACT|nr:hypothetical protein [Prolixibacteraceae bacterium Z1-6]